MSFKISPHDEILTSSSSFFFNLISNKSCLWRSMNDYTINNINVFLLSLDLSSANLFNVSNLNPNAPPLEFKRISTYY